jgi:O-antigen/teichoic acid export membrane protein
VPTLAEILTTAEKDVSIEPPSLEGRRGERLLTLPSGAVAVKLVTSPPSRPENPDQGPDQGVHPGTTQPESPPPNSADEPSAIERDAADEDRAADEDIAAHDQLTPGEVRRRAVTGAMVDGFRAIGVKLVAVVGALVTARLLTPYDFGLVAIGTTVLAFGSVLEDGGVGAALIRRPEPPTKAELQALVAFQFGMDLILVAGLVLAMLPFGLVGRVTSVIALALPLGAFRAPAIVLLERRLNYRPIAVVDVVQSGAYYVWAIATIIIGWGVWGLASAAPISELVGLVVMLVLLPEGRVAPVPSWRKVRPLIGFGLRVQAVGLLHMLRDQGVNLMVASFGGIALLGLWSVAWRIIQLPVSLCFALWRVSYPGMSKLVASKQDVGRTIERVIALVAIGTGVLVVPLAASASAWIPVLMGARWAGAAPALPPACFAMAFGIPISVALSGYLWAIGSASVPMRSTFVGMIATWLLLLSLLPFLGVAGVGIAYIASSLVESLFFVHAARRTTTFALGARLAAPVVVGTISGACGWLVAHWIGPDLAGAVSSSVVALGLFVGGLAAVHRADLTDAWTLVRRGLSGVVAKPAEARMQPQPATQ